MKNIITSPKESYTSENDLTFMQYILNLNIFLKLEWNIALIYLVHIWFQRVTQTPCFNMFWN